MAEKVKFKVWVEVEKYITDPEDEMSEDYEDMECPVGVAYVDTLEEAVELQNEIVDMFGNIPDPLDYENLVQEVFDHLYSTDDPKYAPSNLAYLRSLSLEELEMKLKS